MKVKKIRRHVVRTVLIVGLLCAAVSCSPKLSPQKQAVLAAYNRAESSLFQEEYLEVDVLWILQDILKIENDRQLELLVKKQIGRFATHPYLLLVKPNAPQIELPPNPGEGIDRYFVYIQSAFGRPEKRAAKYVTDFVSKKETGYILTHQFATLLWAEQTGLELPFNPETKKKELLHQIYTEQMQQTHHVCVDLYAERVALLLRYGNATEEDATKWIGKLVFAQRDDGTWPDSNPVIEYDNQKATVKIPPSHTTALAMWALKCYLIKY